jgi:Spy/CpxP family protein refolding chaperone
MLFQAVRALTLTPEQQTKVDAADKMTAAPADPAVHEAAAKDLHSELIAGIKAGKIDTSKLDAKYTAIEHLATAEHDREADSLTALHDALDPGQRKVVTTSVRAKIAKRDEKLATRSDAGAPLLPDGGKPPTAGKRSLERLTRGLELDADQQKKLDAIPTKDDPKVDPAEQKKRVDALLDAFEKDKFDAKKADGFDTKRLRSGLEDETKLLTQILPILKPEQRDKLAAKMERGPSPHGGRRPGFAGRRPLTESEDDDFAN